MSASARSRLAEERKNWRREKPYGFVAKPVTQPDGSVDLMTWSCIIPGKQGTIWEDGFFPLTMAFPDDYPTEPPLCSLPKGFYHPNVFPSGEICLDILNPDACWAASISVKMILLAIQELLDNPNLDSPAQKPAYDDLKKDRKLYEKRVREEVAKYPQPEC